MFVSAIFISGKILPSKYYNNSRVEVFKYSCSESLEESRIININPTTL